MLFKKNNAADSSQLLLQLHFLCKKRLSTCCSVLAEMAVCFGESAAGYSSLTQFITIDCALGRYPVSTLTSTTI